jgi:chemosensory pili system protein ChpA (sensor histidine kinase/response regulator)
MSNPSRDVVRMLQEELQEISASLLSPGLGPGNTPAQALRDLSRRLHRLGGMARALGLAGLRRAIEHAQANVRAWLSQHPNAAQPQLWRLVVEWPLEVNRYLEQIESPDSIATLCNFLGNRDWLRPLPPEEFEILAQEHRAEKPAPPPASIEESLSLKIPDDVSPAMVVELLQEVPDLTERLARLVDTWGEDGKTAHSLMEAQRVAHAIKGAANTVGIRGIARFTHVLEDVLAHENHSPTQSRALRSLVARAVACLHQMSDALLGRGSAPGDAAAILAAMQAHLDGMAADGQAAEAADAEGAWAAGEGAIATVEDGLAAVSALPPAGIRINPALIDEVFRIAGECTVSVNHMRDELQRTRQLAQELARRVMAARDPVQALLAIRAAGGSEGGAAATALGPVKQQDLREAIADALILGEDLQSQIRLIEERLNAHERLNEELRGRVRQCRMMPAAEIVPRLKRAVAQAASLAGKEIEVAVAGSHTLVDTYVLNGVVDPLMHALRNAVDHGIETNVERLRQSKPGIGTVNLTFQHEGNEILIRCEDDGRGLDAALIRQRAIARGIIAPGEELDEEQLARLVFRPGFSTREHASQTSGRGIGMSAIAAQIARLKGSVDIRSRPGKGCTIEIRVPESMLSVGAVLAVVNNYTVAISNRGLLRVSMIEADQVRTEGEEAYAELDGERLPVRTLSSLLFANAPPLTASPRTQLPALLMRAGESRCLVIVEGILGTRTISLTAPGLYLRAVPGLLGTTTMTDGMIVPVLDLTELLAQPAGWTPNAPIEPDVAQPKDSRPLALAVDDSLSILRELTQTLGARGLRTHAIQDGARAWEYLQSVTPSLVIVDANIPGMSGAELCSRIRTDDRLRPVPVIMLSANADAYRARAQQAGATWLLPKTGLRPLLEEVLQRIIAAAGSEAGKQDNSSVPA